MPRHLICDAHEWTNLIFAVSFLLLVKQRPKERFWYLTTFKEDPVELDFSINIKAKLNDVEYVVENQT